MDDPESGPVAGADEITYLPDEEAGSESWRPPNGNLVCIAVGAAIGLLSGLDASADRGAWILGAATGGALGHVAWLVLVLMIRGRLTSAREECADADEPLDP